MSEFVSWYTELSGKVHFLTDADMARAKEVGVMDDVVGHHAIFAVRGWTVDNKPAGEEHECTDFSKPSNFPPEIVAALFDGRMTYGPFPYGLLVPKLEARWAAEWDALFAKRNALFAEREARWNAELDALYAELYAKGWALYAELYAKGWALFAEWEAKGWALFAIPENRAEAWR